MIRALALVAASAMAGVVIVPVPVANMSSLGYRHPCWVDGRPKPCGSDPWYAAAAAANASSSAANASAPTRCAVPVGGAGAVVVGGVGDSGTRGVEAAVHGPLGVDACVVSKWRLFSLKSQDSAVFQPTNFVSLMKAAAAAAAPPLDYSAAAADRWGLADKWDHAMWRTCFAVNVTLECLSGQSAGDGYWRVAPERGRSALRGAAASSYLWGWKLPQSIYQLPLYDALFGDRWRGSPASRGFRGLRVYAGARRRVVHVVRDGRDVAFGDNQNQFGKFHSIYDEERKEAAQKLQFWADANGAFRRRMGFEAFLHFEARA